MLDRRHRRISGAVAVATLLQGCTTFGFSPPPVDYEHKQASQSESCANEGVGTQKISRDIASAIEVTDRFINAYRCARDEAANGRQIFEIPSFLALIAGAVGPTYGLHENGRIAALASSAVLARANSYYAPKQKLGIVDAALDAAICVKTVSVGFTYFDTSRGAPPGAREAAEQLERAAASFRRSQAEATQMRDAARARAEAVDRAAADPSRRGEVQTLAAEREAARTETLALDASIGDFASNAIALETQAARLRAALVAEVATPLTIKERTNDGGTVEIDVKQKYFELVTSALVSIERVFGRRLADAGTFDPEGITAQLQKIAEQTKDKPAGKSLFGSDGVPRVLTPEEVTATIKLELDQLQPRLQECVVRAKLGG